ncbi:MAG: NACHT domain-containing protein [Deltaproteobacteria bacterium]|nr:NACHT domain-containing protein [Deltaproteobacteria bacterium]
MADETTAVASGWQFGRALGQLVDALQDAAGSGLYALSAEGEALQAARPWLQERTDHALVACVDVAAVDRVRQVEPGRVLWLEARSREDEARWLRDIALRRDAWIGPGLGAIVLATRPGLQERSAAIPVDLRHVLEVIPLPTQVETAMRPICWLHLSDLHATVREWRQNQVFRALVRDLPTLLAADGLAPDLVFFTGDVAQSGKELEYEQAQDGINALRDAVGFEMTRLFVVPGNHDVDRNLLTGREGRLCRMLRKQLLEVRADDADGLNDVLGEPENLATLALPQRPFFAFHERLVGPQRALRPTQPFRVEDVRVGGLVVAVASFNSALLAGEEDEKGRLRVGERQIVDLSADAAHADLRIALLHHPVSWLADGEEKAVGGALAAGFDAVLHGHDHEGGSESRASVVGRQFIASAGALYQAKPWPMTVQASRYDPAGGSVESFGYRFDERAGGRWVVDAGMGSGGTSHRHKIALHVVDPAARHEAQSRVVERIAAAAERDASSRPWLGWPVAARPRAPSWLEVYVAQPLRAAPRDHGEHRRFELDRVLQLDALLQRLRGGAKIAVSAAPGMGKSSLCRRVTIGLARSEGDEQPRAPILLQAQDFGPPGDTIEASILRRLGKGLGIAVERADLEALLADGRIVLIVDGLDEVFDVGRRDEILQWLKEACNRLPALGLLVTARETVGEIGDAESLEPWILEGFDDAALTRFFERWFAWEVQDDDARRLREIAALQGELRTNRAAREIASVPMLATLIAMLWLRSGRVPARRVVLLQKVVETLLETWPARRRRGFARLSTGQQRRCLRALASKMLLGGDRARGDQVVTVAESTALRTFADALADPLSSERVATEDLVRDWLRWLVDDAGLLVRIGFDGLTFLHLGVGELLAAEAWRQQTDRTESEAANELLSLAQRHRHIAMLAVQMLDDATGGRVFDAMVGQALAMSESSSDDLHFLLDTAAELGVAHLANGEQLLTRVLQDFGWWEFVFGANWIPHISRLDQENASVVRRTAIAHARTGTPASIFRGGLFAYCWNLDEATEEEVIAELCQRRDRAELIPAPLQETWNIRIARTFSTSDVPTVLSAGRWYASNVLAYGSLVTRAPGIGLPIALASLADLIARAAGVAARGGFILAEPHHASRVSWRLRPAVAILARTTDGDSPRVESGSLIRAMKSAGFSETTVTSGAAVEARTLHHPARAPGESTQVRLSWVPSHAETCSDARTAAIDAACEPAWLAWLGLAVAEAGLPATVRGATGEQLWQDDLVTSALLIATTGMWPTLDGTRATTAPSLWSERYLLALCLLLEDPTNPSRQADLDAEIAACPAEFPGLADELRRWRVHPRGSPDYDTLVEAARLECTSERSDLNG